MKQYHNYLSLEKLSKELTKKLWIYEFRRGSEKSVVMIGKNDKLKASSKIVNFTAIEIQVYDVSFNKKNFSLDPKLLRKISYLK